MRASVFGSSLACGDKRSRVANIASSRVAFSQRVNASSSLRAAPAECCDKTVAWTPDLFHATTALRARLLAGARTRSSTNRRIAEDRLRCCRALSISATKIDKLRLLAPRDFLQPAPERISQTDTGLVSVNHY